MASGLPAVEIPVHELEEVVAKQPVVVAWQHLSVYANKGGRVLLCDVSGSVEPGFTAIMGPSGSGKTTLLNALAHRLEKNMHSEGELRLNGQPYSRAVLKKVSGYVMQDDLLNVHLTVKETLSYTARLQMGQTQSPEECAARVDEIVSLMGLDKCRDVIVGNPEKRGVSGGERKRLCIGMELLTKPGLLFLDEPTSGLDSVTALALCGELRGLGSSLGTTIVSTIHQPQAKIFSLFDALIVLKSGATIYNGPPAEAIRFYAEAGFPVPVYTNPADHILDIITPALQESPREVEANEQKLKAQYSAPAIDLSAGADHPLDLSMKPLPWRKQYAVLCRRSFQEARRKWVNFAIMCGQSIVMAGLIGGVFFQIGDTQSSVTRRQPVLFFCVINQGMFGALSLINAFPAERLLSLRERAAGMYYSSAYFAAKTSVDTLVQLPTPIIFSCVAYWMVGLQPVASKFFIFMTFMTLCQFAATSLALMVSAVCRTTDLSVVVLPMYLEVSRLFGGFFLSPANLPAYFKWINILSYVNYTYIGISHNELDGLELTCTPKQLNAQGTCPITSGQQVVDDLGLDWLSMGECFGILIAYIVILRILAYLGIRFLK